MTSKDCACSDLLSCFVSTPSHYPIVQHLSLMLVALLVLWFLLTTLHPGSGHTDFRVLSQGSRRLLPTQTPKSTPKPSPKSYFPESQSRRRQAWALLCGRANVWENWALREGLGLWSRSWRCPIKEPSVFAIPLCPDMMASFFKYLSLCLRAFSGLEWARLLRGCVGSDGQLMGLEAALNQWRTEYSG